MTVPAQVLAAVRSIPHPRQETPMTAPHPSPAEQAVIDRFETAPPAPESFDAVAALRRVEALAAEWERDGWLTWTMESGLSDPGRTQLDAVRALRAAIAAPQTGEEW